MSSPPVYSQWYGLVTAIKGEGHFFLLHYEYYLQPCLLVEKEGGDRSLDWCSDGWLITTASFLQLDRQLLASAQSLCRPGCPACPWLQLLGKKPIRPGSLAFGLCGFNQVRRISSSEQVM
jgi:hypothetical protein